jgi:hypothetical protein
MASSNDSTHLDSIFFTKYNEFCEELKGAFPEATVLIEEAARLSESDKKRRFREEVVPTAGNPKRNPKVCPGPVLPGVSIPEGVWTEFSETTKKAIQEYLTLLSFSSLFGSEGFDKKWAEEAMKTMKEKLNSADFKSLSEKLMGMFSSGSFSHIPERLMKGQIAKLAEELVREFRPEDFGLDPTELAAAGDNPSRAFEMLSTIYTRNPDLLQNAMKRIARRLQEKVQRGELRPAELAAEAEELIKEFTENPAMKELMESFKSMFGFEDEEAARSVGRDGEGRLAIARSRLRKKLEAKKAGGAGAGGKKGK